jgi:hypothetical protein
MKHSFAFVVAAGIALIGLTPLSRSHERIGAAAGPDVSGCGWCRIPGSEAGRRGSTTCRSRDFARKSSRTTLEIEASERAGNVVNTMPRRADCPVGNLPMMMASSPPLNIVAAQGRGADRCRIGRGRFIYTDGRQHPDTKAPSYVPSGFGHSIGRWEGDTLVVDTVAFPPACATAVAGDACAWAARAKDSTHLVERFRLVDRDTLVGHVHVGRFDRLSRAAQPTATLQARS